MFLFGFGKFLSYKNPALFYLYREKTFGNEINSEIHCYVTEFLIYGKYPRVVTAETTDEKITVLKNIFNTLMLREVKDLLAIIDTKNLLNFIKALSLQIGNLINYSELGDITTRKYPNLKNI